MKLLPITMILVDILQFYLEFCYYFSPNLYSVKTTQKNKKAYNMSIWKKWMNTLGKTYK